MLGGRLAGRRKQVWRRAMLETLHMPIAIAYYYCLLPSFVLYCLFAIAWGLLSGGIAYYYCLLPSFVLYCLFAIAWGYCLVLLPIATACCLRLFFSACLLLLGAIAWCDCLLLLPVTIVCSLVFVC